MGNVNMEAHQIHYKGEETAKTMFEKLDLIAQQVGDLPTFTSDDRAFLEKLPALPTAEGKTVLTAETDDHGETNLSYAAPEVEGEDVAPEFSDAEAYSAGDLVFHGGILYKFTSDHAAGDWDATEATPTSVGGELSALKNTLTPFVLKKGTYTKLLGGIGYSNSYGSSVTANTGYYVSDDVTTITIESNISNIFWRKYDGTDLSASRSGTRLSIDYNKEITIQHYGSDANILPANSVGIAQATCTFTLS